MIFIQADPSLSPQECFTAIKDKFALLYTDENGWQDILRNLKTKESLFRTMRRAKANALGLTDSLVSRIREAEISEGKEIARKMQKEMIELVKVCFYFLDGFHISLIFLFSEKHRNEPFRMYRIYQVKVFSNLQPRCSLAGNCCKLKQEKNSS
jgi:hypothetical protein